MIFRVVGAVALIKLYDLVCCWALPAFTHFHKNWPRWIVEFCSHYPTSFFFCQSEVQISVVCIRMTGSWLGISRLWLAVTSSHLHCFFLYWFVLFLSVLNRSADSTIFINCYVQQQRVTGVRSHLSLVELTDKAMKKDLLSKRKQMRLLGNIPNINPVLMENLLREKELFTSPKSRRCAACRLQVFIQQFTLSAPPFCSIAYLQYFRLIRCQQMPKCPLSGFVEAFLHFLWLLHMKVNLWFPI